MKPAPLPPTKSQLLNLLLPLLFGSLLVTGTLVSMTDHDLTPLGTAKIVVPRIASIILSVALALFTLIIGLRKFPPRQRES
jgi:hypothetical protein